LLRALLGLGFGLLLLNVESICDFEELVFIFQNPRTPMPGARRRADGTKYTMQEWAEKQGFTWYTLETCPAGWSKKL